VVAALVATGLLAALARWARRPLRTFRIIAVVALILSFGGPLQVGAGMMQGGAVGGAAVAAMLVMHVVAAAIIVGLLTTLAHTTERGGITEMELASCGLARRFRRRRATAPTAHAV